LKFAISYQKPAKKDRFPAAAISPWKPVVYTSGPLGCKHGFDRKILEL
jgi:hypothetical protein